MNASFYMREALEFSKFSIGISRPNPAVGAVVVLNDKIVGKGRTQMPGSSHAEVCALKEAGINAIGADLYVTLEPCCHFGRTPPCTSAIIESRIKRVFFAHTDKNPLVHGKSRKILEENGIEVFEGLKACGNKETFDLIEHYFEAYDYFLQTGKTFVELKVAVTKNFKMANADKTPLKITGDLANVQSHEWRSIADAILVGASTVLHDNPSLNVRLCKGNNPIKIVMANSTLLDSSAKIFLGNKVIVYSVIQQKQLENKAEVVLLPGKDFKTNFEYLLHDISLRGMRRLMVEPGQKLAENIFKTGLWSRLYLWKADFEIDLGLDFPEILQAQMIYERAYGQDILQVYENRR